MTPFEDFLKAYRAGTVKTPVVNGGAIPYLRYQLAVHKRDLALWAAGIKPNRAFKVSEYKKYYGLKGNDRKALLEQFKVIFDKTLNDDVKKN